MSIYKSHGSGRFKKSDFLKIGQNVIIEEGVRIFHSENIEIGSNVYIGHDTIINGHKGQIKIANRAWIGPQSFLFGVGGLTIGENVGIGPGVKILTSAHDLSKDDLGAIINLPIRYGEICIEKNCDIGMGAIILPETNLKEGTQVGAGAVVTKNTPKFSIVAGIPAKVISYRKNKYEKEIDLAQIFFKKIQKSITNILRILFDAIFLILFPILFLYGWLRFILKKILKIKPSILISPLGAPLPFNNVKVLRSQGLRADNLALDCPKYFKDTSLGLIVSENKLLRYLAYFSDYLFLFIWAILKYDIFEFPFSGGILAHSNLRKLELPILKSLSKKIMVYGHGSDCKILSQVRSKGFKYNNAMDRAENTEANSEKIISENVYRAKKYADVLIAGGDLIDLGVKSIMLPLALDLDYWKFSGLKNKKILNIAHSTNHRSHKGTRFILEIFEKIRNKLPVRMFLIEQKTTAECKKLYHLGDIFVPDVITGWHGLTAIEAMATGRPVVTYLRSDIKKFHNYYAKNIPIISANPDNLAKTLEKLVKNFKLRKQLAEKGRDYVQKYHSFEFVGACRLIIVNKIWRGEKIDQKILEKELKKKKLI